MDYDAKVAVALKSTGDTPLHLASMHGFHGKLFERMITKGANVNARRKDGATPIHLAAQFGHADCFNSLLSLGGDPSIPDFVYQRSAFDVATGEVLNSIQKAWNG